MNALEFVYFTMLTAFLTHELDAVKRHEWRVLPLTSFLPERLGEQVFIWIHFPIFMAIFWFGHGEPVNGFRVGLAVFAMVHVGLHWAYRNHPAYEFNNVSSWTIILLTGLLGGVYLALAWTA